MGAIGESMGSGTSADFSAADFQIGNNVNPGLINPKRLFNWKGTMTKYQIIMMTIGGIPS